MLLFALRHTLWQHRSVFGRRLSARSCSGESSLEVRPPFCMFYILFVAVEARQRAGKQITRCSVATLLPLLCLDGASRDPQHTLERRGRSVAPQLVHVERASCTTTAGACMTPNLSRLDLQACQSNNSVSLDDHPTRSHIVGKRSDR